MKGLLKIIVSGLILMCLACGASSHPSDDELTDLVDQQIGLLFQVESKRLRPDGELELRGGNLEEEGDTPLPLFLLLRRYDSGWIVMQFSDDGLNWRPISELRNNEDSLQSSSPPNEELDLALVKGWVEGSLDDPMVSVVVRSAQNRGQTMLVVGDLSFDGVSFPASFEMVKQGGGFVVNKIKLQDEGWVEVGQFATLKQNANSSLLLEVIQNFLAVKDIYPLLSDSDRDYLYVGTFGEILDFIRDRMPDQAHQLLKKCDPWGSEYIFLSGDSTELQDWTLLCKGPDLKAGTDDDFLFKNNQFKSVTFFKTAHSATMSLNNKKHP